LLTKFLTLLYAEQKQVYVFLTEIKKELKEINLVHDTYPVPNSLVLRGSTESVNLTVQLLEQWENGFSEISSADPDIFTLEPEVEVEDPETGPDNDFKMVLL
jgi:hypothetical protein